MEIDGNEDQNLYDSIIKHFVALKIYGKRGNSNKLPFYYILDSCESAEVPPEVLYKFGIVFIDEKQIAIKGSVLSKIIGSCKTSLYNTMMKLKMKRVSLDNCYIKFKEHFKWSIFDYSENSHLTRIVSECPAFITTSPNPQKRYTAKDNILSTLQFFQTNFSIFV